MQRNKQTLPNFAGFSVGNLQEQTCLSPLSAALFSSFRASASIEVVPISFEQFESFQECPPWTSLALRQLLAAACAIFGIILGLSLKLELEGLGFL
ncbi:hypothetical protein VNO80_10520 [Phaseolus coccineus]|uniref:Uncharacterized protein n=1 Tax=Phaseolus coccineus TaxID=3886 RepID=A0AAN9REP8_PHACN